MKATKNVTYTFAFDPDELAAVTEALNSNAEHSILADTNDQVQAILARINAGEPLTRGQMEDLRVFIVRFCKAASNSDCYEDFPPVLAEIALGIDKLQR